MAMEEEFNVSISDERCGENCTVQDAIDYIQKALASENREPPLLSR